MLQVGNTFWLFEADIATIDEYGYPKDYTLRLLRSWKNYDKQRALIKLDVIRFDLHIMRDLISSKRKSGSMDRTDAMVKSIGIGDYHIVRGLNKHTIYKDDGTKAEKHIPILKACGLANLIDSHEMYLALEEYFSMEKSSAERTESAGLTDNEKIGNHGFDLKSSFRGKP